MSFMRPCMKCGTLTRGSNYCDEHRRVDIRSEAKLAERAVKKKFFYNTEYRKAAEAVRDNAVMCHICGKPAKANDPWQADHLIPGDPLSPLAPAHRSCNASRGNRPIN